jgi:hypothetical protein
MCSGKVRRLRYVRVAGDGAKARKKVALVTARPFAALELRQQMRSQRTTGLERTHEPSVPWFAQLVALRGDVPVPVELEN